MNISLHPESVLFVTLDSCRFDSFRDAYIPSLKAIAPFYKAMAPSYFTYASHAAFWMGFTPGISSLETVPMLNPKFGKLFRMTHSASSSHGKDAFELSGSNIIQGFRELGYHTIGSGAVAWFDQSTPTGSVLSEPFDEFWYSGHTSNLRVQLSWLLSKLIFMVIVDQYSCSSMLAKLMFPIGMKALAGINGLVLILLGYSMLSS